MGVFSVAIEIGDPGGERYESIDAVVDTGATYTVVPASRLRRLRVTPRPTSPFELADGSLRDFAIGETRVSPNPPKDTDGRREDSGRGVGEGATGEMAWALGVDGRPADGLQSPHRAPKALCESCDARDWREDTQQGTLADRGGASLRGRWVSCRLAVRPGMEWLAAGPRRD